MRSAERIHNMLHVPGSLQLGYYLASSQYSRHCCAVGFFSQHPCCSTREQFKSIWRLKKTKHQTSNETLKTSNKRRLSGEKDKSYISISHLLHIHRENWACSAFSFTPLLPTRGCSSQKEKKMSIRRGKSEFIRTSTCPFTFLHPSR